MSRLWLDKFIDQKLIKIAKEIRANYVEQLAKIFEGKLNTKFSSIDEALTDFATRLGLSSGDLQTLKKEAQIKATLHKQASKNTEQIMQKLQDDGITDPKAIRFMSKSKNKHTLETSSPYALDQKQGEELAKLLEDQKEKYTTPDDQNQLNEMSKSATLKQADFPKKIFPFDKPSIEQIVKELEERKPIKQYRTARTAFKFRSIEKIGSKGSFPTATGSPIAVTIYAFAFHKDKVIDFITKDLLKVLSSELKPTEWAQKIQHLAKESDRPLLLERLREINELLTKEQVDINKKDKMIEFIKLLPISYQDQVLRLLASGYYKHLIPEASGRTHAYVFSSRYEQSTFVLMKSFAPYKQLLITEKNKEKLGQFLSLVLSEQDKQTLKTGQNIKLDLQFNQARSTLDAAGVEYKEVTGTEDSTEINFAGGRIQINILSIINDDYQPLTLEKSIKDPKEQEAIAAQFTDAIHEASRANLPLAFEAKQHEGTTFFEGKTLNDLTIEKTNFLDPNIKKDQILIPNPMAGLHPTYKGKIPEIKTPLTGPTLPKLSNKLLTTLEKYAQHVEIWLDDQGRFYSNQDQLQNIIVAEMMEHEEEDIINKVVESTLSTIGTSSAKVPTKLLEKNLQKPELSANSKTRLTKVAIKLNNQSLINLLLKNQND